MIPKEGMSAQGDKYTESWNLNTSQLSPPAGSECAKDAWLDIHIIYEVTPPISLVLV